MVKKMGEYVLYYEGGPVNKEGKYVDGKKEGEWFSYYENGNTKEKENYVDGKKEGEWTQYDENGKVISEKFYIQDQDQHLASRWATLINIYGYDIYNIFRTEILTPNSHSKYSVLKEAIDYIAFLEKKLGLNISQQTQDDDEATNVLLNMSQHSQDDAAKRPLKYVPALSR